MEYEYIKIPKAESRNYSADDLQSILRTMMTYYSMFDEPNHPSGFPSYDQKLPQIMFYLIYESYINRLSKEDQNKIWSIIETGNNFRKKAKDLPKLIRDMVPTFVPPVFTNETLQKIYYGAPGCGKSHKAKERSSAYTVFRTTFHPDTDYAGFVGSYKPKLNEKGVVRNSEGRAVDGEYDKKIEYSFIPQVFTNAYIEAWNRLLAGQQDPNPAPVCLLIEELNRGNCAQIFGDLFQLLDRNSSSYSEYSIIADSDLADYIKRKLGDDKFQKYYNVIQANCDLTENGRSVPEWDSTGDNEVRLCLPPNLSIICTMNTSDQSLFPMDSAFKRRWEWEYVPIDYTLEKSNFIICIDAAHKYRWLDFLKVTNGIIYDKTKSEDKQMGNFFVKGNSQKEVSCEQFVSKVMFYLWNEICKDNPSAKKAIFVSELDKADGGSEDTTFTFNKLFEGDKDETLIGFMDHLKVQNIASGEDPSTSESDKKSYKEHLSEFGKYCNDHTSVANVQKFMKAFKLPNPRWNELWIRKIEGLSGCSIKIGVNKTGAYIGWYPSDFETANNNREAISTEFGITQDELSGYSSSGWKSENEYFKIQFEKAEKKDEEEFQWIVETSLKLFDYFSK